MNKIVFSENVDVDIELTMEQVIEKLDPWELLEAHELIKKEINTFLTYGLNALFDLLKE